MATNNDVLRGVDDRARVYRTAGKVVEVDVAFGEYMFITGFECGKEHQARGGYYGDGYEQAITHAADKWKERQAKP